MSVKLKVGSTDIGSIGSFCGNVRNLAPVYDQGWSRPSDWLPLPTLNQGEQKAVMLFGVFNDDSNLVAFTANGNYTVDWGDGIVENFNSGVTAEHDYNFNNPLLNGTTTSDGFKQAIITITPQAGQNLTLLNFNIRPSIYVSNAFTPMILDMAVNSQPLIGIGFSAASGSERVSMGVLRKFWLGEHSLTRISFKNCFSLVEINQFNTQNFTSTGAMFANCFSLLSIPLFDTRNVTNMNDMFGFCTSLRTIPLLNTQNVTSMFGMFNYCRSLETIPLLNTQKVTNMGSMFTYCHSLYSIPLLDTRNVTNMSSMFQECFALQNVPQLNTQNVTNMGSMFNNCRSIKTIPLFNTQNVTSMHGMFFECQTLQSVPFLNTSKVSDMANMFNNCRSINIIPLLDTQNASNTNGMFTGCRTLEYIPNLNTQNVTNMNAMFNGCNALQIIPMLNAQNSNDLASIFANCSSLKKATLSRSRRSISYGNLPLSKNDLIDIFTNLNKIGAASQSITITGTYGSTQNPATTRAGFDTVLGSSIITTSNTSGISAGMLIVGTNITGNSQLLTLSSTTNVVNYNGHNIPNGTPIAFSILSMSGIAGTFNQTTERITSNNHGLLEGDLIFFELSNNGLTADFPYYVRNPSTNDFQISVSPNGTIFNLTGSTANTFKRVGTFFPFYVINSTTNTFQISREIGGSAVQFSANGTGNIIIGDSFVTSVNPNVSITIATPAVATGTNQSLTFRDLNTSIATLKGWTIIS